MLNTNIINIFNILDKAIPIPSTELEYDEDPYLLLVSVRLSAQSTDTQVNKVTKHLFPVANTPQQIIDLGYEKLTSIINSIGLYKNKAKDIINFSHKLIEEHNGKVPSSREALMSLPGVGRKSADVILNVLFNKPTVPVDTHVFRVCHRLSISNIRNRDKMAAYLEQELPNHLTHDLMLKAHHLMVLHGRYTCTAKKPKCDICPLKNYCTYYKTTYSNPG